jgi:hypothetical protein
MRAKLTAAFDERSAWMKTGRRIADPEIPEKCLLMHFGRKSLNSLEG